MECDKREEQSVLRKGNVGGGGDVSIGEEIE